MDIDTYISMYTTMYHQLNIAREPDPYPTGLIVMLVLLFILLLFSGRGSDNSVGKYVEGRGYIDDNNRIKED